MGTNPIRSWGSRLSAPLILTAGVVFALPADTLHAQQDPPQGVIVPAEASVETLFTDFLHYARLGRFTLADSLARTLIDHPDLNLIDLAALADRDPGSITTLLTLVQNTTIGENARTVHDLILQGRFEQRQDDERILKNIAQLGGDPQQEAYAIRHLAESGEYALPLMLQTLLDPAQRSLWPRVINALPQIGKGAVNPLVYALRVRNDDVRIHLVRALGEIGYPQAIPYLTNLTIDENLPESTKQAARDAIARIGSISGRTIPGSPADQFHQLAEKYYNEDPSVRADPRLPEANIWNWNDQDQALVKTIIPEAIFGPVMAMRVAGEGMKLQNDKVETIALWLASNIRRESRLGLDVESDDPDETGIIADPNQPVVFPRALSFSNSYGPRSAHLVLDRAIREGDVAVALGSIRALDNTLGESSQIGTQQYRQPLVQALRFPDMVVRMRAALALGKALPKTPFADSEFVVPTLAAALNQTGRREILVVDTDGDNLNRILTALRDDADMTAIGETTFYKALSRARMEFALLSAVFVSSDIQNPGLARAIADLRSEFLYAQTPVVVLVKPEHSVLAEQAIEGDAYAYRIDAGADGAMLVESLAQLAEGSGQNPLDDDLALSLALDAAETLRKIAVDGRTVFNFSLSEPALIRALAAADEGLQIKSASVLALAPTRTAQRSIAFVALDDAHTKTLRHAAFSSLAESAKNHGNLLEDDQIARLLLIARDDPDMETRAKASAALGAINLRGSRASEIILKYHKG